MNDELQKLLNKRPNNREKLLEWRVEVKRLRERLEKESTISVKKRENQWKRGEWDLMKEKLNYLSLQELSALSTAVGIDFTIGNEKIKSREEFILVLDEADKKKLYSAYDSIISKRK